MQENHIVVKRTARYFTLGNERTAGQFWLVLHGYGQLARYFLNSFQGLEEGRLIMAPEGLSRFYLDEDHVRVGATWMTREDREFEIVDQAEYLDALLEVHSELRPGLRKINVLGFSQGVATAARWASRTAYTIDRLVFWSGTLPPELPGTPARDKWSKTRIELVHGEQDTLTPESVLARNMELLRQLQLEPSTKRHPGAHTLDRVTLERVMAE